MPRTFLAPLALAVLAAGALAVAPAAGQQPAPTAATEQLRRWLDVFNAGDRERWRQFLAEYAVPGREPLVDQNIGLRQQTGGFDLLRFDSVTAARAVATVREKDGEGIGATLTIEVEAAPPHRIVDVQVQPGLRLPVGVDRLTTAALPAAVETEIARRAARDQFAGAVLIAQRGRTVYQTARGMADRERGLPNRPDTRFRNGSMNKMFTAVAVMTLVQAGKVRLEDPIGKYLPGYPNPAVANRVTVHQLLTHTGGTGDVFGPEFAPLRDELREHQDYVKRFAKAPLLFEPGSRWMYSNYGFILLGVLIESVSGQRYDDYVRAHVYVPAGMIDTGAEPEAVSVPRRSIGYMRPPGAPAWLPNTPTLPYRGTAAGGGYTTVGDLVRFADALMSHKLLNAATTTRMITGRVEGAGGTYGYGFIEHVSNGARSIGHGGNAPGMDGDLQIFPDSGYVVAVLANVDPPAAQRVSQFIANRVPTK